MADLTTKTDFTKTGECIGKINAIFNDYDKELENLPKLSDKIIEYVKNYQKFENIKRFSIPIIGKINCGKSTILNCLLNLNDTLEYSCDTTTKFVSIIRHNKELKGKSPLIYNVKFELRAYVNNIYLYNFEKDGDNLQGDVKDIIKVRNEKLRNKQLDEFPENYFYIIESYIPLFEGKLENFSDYFEFMDVPGLNESTLEENKENVYLDKVIPLFINNIKFAMFIFDATNYEKQNNSIINTRDVFSIFYDKMNNFYKKKNIKLLQNSIFVLNKIDESDKEGNREEIDFKNYLQYTLHAPIKDNYIVHFRADKEYLTRNRFNNFEKYLDYIKLRDKNDGNNIFKKKLIEHLQKDLKIEIEDQIDDEDDDEDEENEVKDELWEKIHNFNNLLTNRSFDDKITKSNYLFYKKYFDEKKSNSNQNFKKDEITINLEKSINKAYQDFIDKDKYKKNIKFYDEILKILNIQKEEIEGIKNQNKVNNFITLEEFSNQKNYQEILNYEGKIYEELYKMESNHEYIKKIYEKYLYEKDYIIKKIKYKIAVFGEYSSGKSSLLNALIGKDILPESSGHCTKVILIIQYTQDEKDISLYTSKFNYKNSNNLINYFIEDKLIAKGEESVKEELKKINNNSKGGISYYIINTPIKFLDENIEDKKIKNKIQFFDLPGIDSLMKEYVESDFPKLMDHIDLFIYSNGTNVILQKESESTIKKMFEFLLVKRGSFNLDSIIFIINFYDKLDIENKTMGEKKIQKFKDIIYQIFKKFKEKDWNRYINNFSNKKENEDILCFFFSKIKFIEEEKKYYDILDFKSFFTNLNQKYQNLKIKEKIREIKAYIKKNYINNLINKHNLNTKEIKLEMNGINEKYLNDLKMILKISNSEFNDNKENIKSIVIMYDFFLKNKSNFNYTFNDFILKLREKISKENINHILDIIHQMSINLLKDFKLIENNILRWKSNNPISSLPNKNKFSIIHEFYINNIESIYNTKVKEIENNFSKMMSGENTGEKINKIIEDLLTNVEQNYHSYFTEMKKEMKSLGKNIILDSNTGNLFLIDFKLLYKIYGSLAGIISSIAGIYYTYCGIVGIQVQTAFFTTTFSSGLIGGVIGFALGGLASLIGLALSLLFFKLISRLLNKKEVLLYSNQIMSKLEAIKYKIKREIDLLYYSSNELFNEMMISQKKPIKNII